MINEVRHPRRRPRDPDCAGYIVQLPLPRHLDENAALERVDPDKDADGLTPMNLGRLVLGIPATPHAPRWAPRYAWLVVGNIECAAAAFARVWFGLSPAAHPTTSYLDALRDERTVVMANGSGDGLLPEGASNPNMGPFTPKLGVRLRGDRKGGKVDGFPLAALSQHATVNAGPRPGGAAARLRYRRALNVSCGWPRPARGRLVSAHRGDLPAPKKSARVLFSSQPRHCPADPGPWPGTQPAGCDR
jgi:hypothetical protein